METPAEQTLEQTRDLQRCINDLVTLLAFPAMWTGRGPSEIVSSFADGLLTMLRLDVVYVRLTAEVGAPAEYLRVPHGMQAQLAGAGELLTAFGNEQTKWPRQLTLSAGATALSIEPVRLGLNAQMGFVVAGAQRAQFPLQTEQLLLNVAANQLVVALQEAQRRLEQQRVAEELDEYVAKRTTELAAINVELRKEITERIHIQAQLPESEALLKKSASRLRQVIDCIPNIAWCNLTDGSNEFLNKAWGKYTGLPPEESTGWAWAQAMHPDDLPKLMTKWMGMLVSSESGEIEGRFRRYDGVYRWFLIRAEPFLDEAGRLVRWYGTSTDIDDRKRAEEALLASEREFTQIVNTIPALVWSARPDGSGAFFSESYLAYVGLAMDALLGWGWTAVVHPEDLGALVAAWQSIRAGGKPAEIEARLRRFDGEYRWFLFRGNPVLDELGQVTKWYGINTDIDDRKQAEEALSKARTELANVARVTSLGVLTAAIAHEVNQPISGIITNASTCLRMLSAQPPNIEGALETARRNIRDGMRAADVITRLRTLYTKRDVQPEPMDLNEAAREVTSLSLSELQRNGVILRHELADDLPPVKGDRIQLQQVILNLLRNGSDAMSTVEDRPRELLIGTEPDEAGRVRLSVKDAGVGFSAEGAGRVFEPFYTTKTEGMGIGLSVSRSIIEAHGGTLWARPNDGPGVTFAFSLPRAQ
jgi:PAS domain S-box-containing protein